MMPWAGDDPTAHFAVRTQTQGKVTFPLRLPHSSPHSILSQEPSRLPTSWTTQILSNLSLTCTNSTTVSWRAIEPFSPSPRPSSLTSLRNSLSSQKQLFKVFKVLKILSISPHCHEGLEVECRKQLRTLSLIEATHRSWSSHFSPHASKSAVINCFQPAYFKCNPSVTEQVPRQHRGNANQTLSTWPYNALLKVASKTCGISRWHLCWLFGLGSPCQVLPNLFPQKRWHINHRANFWQSSSTLLVRHNQQRKESH